MDGSHLIFGDRYDGNRGIPEGVLEAMEKFVDVLSAQYFREPAQGYRKVMVQECDGWQKLCGKPVLVAEIGNWCATEMNPQRKSALDGHEERGRDYGGTVGLLMNQKWCVGVHWFGYVKNKGGRGRGWGLLMHSMSRTRR